MSLLVESTKGTTTICVLYVKNITTIPQNAKRYLSILLSRLTQIVYIAQKMTQIRTVSKHKS
jgi:hypothetical protein